MKAIITSDIHLTDRPADAYRFDLFPWLRKMAQEHGASRIMILGDLTDAKDHHSAALVNKIAEEIEFCGSEFYTLILAGNHDGIDPTLPFFRFARGFENVGFITKPHYDRGGAGSRNDKSVLYLPHSRQPEEDWRHLGPLEADYIFAHQTFRGAKTENGTRLDGLSATMLKPRLFGCSGDIHVPQKIGGMVYCGAPYHVHFGDSFTPRVIHLDGADYKNLYFPAPRKLNIEVSSLADLERADFREGDQGRLTLSLRRADFDNWADTRQKAIDYCQRRGLQLFGVETKQVVERPTRAEAKEAKAAASRTDRDIMEDFAARRQLADDVLAAGLKIAGL